MYNTVFTLLAYSVLSLGFIFGIGWGFNYYSNNEKKKSLAYYSSLFFKITLYTNNLEEEYYFISYSKDGKNYERLKSDVFKFKPLVSGNILGIVDTNYNSKSQAIEELRKLKIFLGVSKLEETHKIID